MALHVSWGWMASVGTSKIMDGVVVGDWTIKNNAHGKAAELQCYLDNIVGAQNV